MPTAVEQAQDQFERIVGPWGYSVVFDQSDWTEQHQISHGVCAGLSRLWVTTVLADPNALPSAFLQEFQGLTPLGRDQFVKYHLDNNKFTNIEVPTIGHQSRVKKRLKPCWRSEVFKNRDALISHILLNPGVYLYTFGSVRNRAAHVVAFEYYRGSYIRFFDPNLGFYTSQDTAKFKEWYSWLWSAEIFQFGRFRSYKAIVLGGYRALDRYELAPNN